VSPTIELAGLDVQLVDTLDRPAAPIVVLMHGFSMSADDLSPFGASMAMPAVFLFPDGPIDLGDAPAAVASPAPARRARAWWRIDTVARDAAIAAGIDRDLSGETPAGLPDARTRLVTLLDQVEARWPGRPLFVGGFSQGAILSLDMVLRTGRRPAGLVLLSGARVDAAGVRPLMTAGALAGLPVFQSHGRADTELSFRAAERLSAELAAAGADVTWRPFDGGHEIPLPVLRELKKFIRVNTVPGADIQAR
jgi:phospholipase/carboxylesterase